MKQKIWAAHIYFFVYEIPTEKSPHTYIGGKKEKSPIKIKSSDIFLCFFLQYLIYEILFHLISNCQTQNMPLLFICITNLVKLNPFKKYLDISKRTLHNFFVSHRHTILFYTAN